MVGARSLFSSPFCLESAARSFSESGAAMSMFLGQPPESRWYRSRLSATRAASAPAYHSGFCLSALRQLMTAEDLSPACCDCATAASAAGVGASAAGRSEEHTCEL